jgi:hypothetical protein
MNRPKAVVVTYRERDDWALILIAWRDQFGQRGISPLIIVPQTSVMLLGLCGAGTYVLPTAHVKESLREECLKNAVADYVRQAREEYMRVIEQASPGLIQNLRTLSYDEATSGFQVPVDAAFRRLCNSRVSDKAMAALRLVRFLADKHKLGEPTLEESDNVAVNKLLNQRW